MPRSVVTRYQHLVYELLRYLQHVTYLALYNPGRQQSYALVQKKSKAELVSHLCKRAYYTVDPDPISLGSGNGFRHELSVKHDPVVVCRQLVLQDLGVMHLVLLKLRLVPGDVPVNLTDRRVVKSANYIKDVGQVTIVAKPSKFRHLQERIPSAVPEMRCQAGQMNLAV